MHPFLRKTSTKANVINKRGLPFYFPFIKKRIIFFMGVLACLFTLNYVTGYVWAIEYVGNMQISDDEMTDFARQENIHYGIKKKSINCEEEEKHLRENFPNVTWTSIYFEGTKLYIEVKENEKTEPQLSETKGTDIIADEEGVITSIVTRNGVPNIKAGDTVEKGQLLVSGSVPVYDEEQNIVNYQIYDADADIYIRTLIEYESDIESSYPVIYYTGRNINSKFVELCGYHIDAMKILNFFVARRNMQYETMTQKNQVLLLDNIYLPVFYGKINRKEYYVQYLMYTENEMKDKLSENLEKFILGLEEKGVQIVEKNVKMVQNRNDMELDGSLLVIKPTGVSVEISDDNNNQDDIKE
jgi:similar to stage IV sporulation protein